MVMSCASLFASLLRLFGRGNFLLGLALMVAIFTVLMAIMVMVVIMVFFTSNFLIVFFMIMFMFMTLSSMLMFMIIWLLISKLRIFLRLNLILVLSSQFWSLLGILNVLMLMIFTTIISTNELAHFIKLLSTILVGRNGLWKNMNNSH